MSEKPFSGWNSQAAVPATELSECDSSVVPPQTRPMDTELLRQREVVLHASADNAIALLLHGHGVVSTAGGQRRIAVRRTIRRDSVLIYYAETGNMLKTVCQMRTLPAQCGRPRSIWLHFGVPLGTKIVFAVLTAAALALPLAAAVYDGSTGEPLRVAVAVGCLFGGVVAGSLVIAARLVRGLIKREAPWRTAMYQWIVDRLKDV